MGLGDGVELGSGVGVGEIGMMVAQADKNRLTSGMRYDIFSMMNFLDTDIVFTEKAVLSDHT